MRKMKKFMSLLLAAVMVLSVMTVNVFAEDAESLEITQTVAPANDEDQGEGSITVTTPEKEKATYNIYRLFDLESYSGTNFSYKVVDEWKAFFTAGGEGATYITVDGDGYITSATNSEADAAVLAALVSANLEDKTPVATIKAGKSDELVKFEDLSLGYYLITSTYGSNGICILTTTKPDAEVAEKNIKPVLEKFVEEGKDNWVEKNDAQRNADVNFKIEVTNLEGDINTYVVEDELSEYFTLDFDSIKVFLNDDEVDVDVNETQKGFTVDFEDWRTTTKVNDVITITYTAELNAGAPVNTAILNTATLTYTDDVNDGDDEVLVDITNTYTWDMSVFKYTGKLEEEHTALAGAKFVLRANKDSENADYFCYDATEGFYWDNDKDKAVVVTSNDEGLAKSFAGLDSGTYYLEEIEAPAGYNMLTERVEVVLKATGNVEGAIDTDAEDYVDYIAVQNNTGIELPGTGGIGTTIFRVGGSALIIVAAVLLITKKRANNI